MVKREVNLTCEARTLDICCGTGNFADLVNGEYLGIDMDQNYIAYAKSRFKNSSLKSFVVSDAVTSEYKPAYFDNVFLIGALHHLPDDSASKILIKINKTARGRIIVTEPAVETANPISRLLILFDKGMFVRTLSRQLELISCHLKVIKHFTFQSGLAHIRMIVCETLENR